MPCSPLLSSPYPHSDNVTWGLPAQRFLAYQSVNTFICSGQFFLEFRWGCFQSIPQNYRMQTQTRPIRSPWPGLSPYCIFLNALSSLVLNALSNRHHFLGEAIPQPIPLLGWSCLHFWEFEIGFFYFTFSGGWEFLLGSSSFPPALSHTPNLPNVGQTCPPCQGLPQLTASQGKVIFLSKSA